MKCPRCGSSAMVYDCRDIHHAYKGHNRIIAGVNCHHCTDCGENILQGHEARRVSKAMNDFNRKVNGELTDPEFILSVRKKLGLSQSQAAEIFGGGKNAFSRYETKSSTPPKSLVLLFQLLDRHPDLLSEFH